jgi:hypothetical protein
VEKKKKKKRKVMSAVSIDFGLKKSISFGSDLGVHMPEI